MRRELVLQVKAPLLGVWRWMRSFRPHLAWVVPDERKQSLRTPRRSVYSAGERIAHKVQRHKPVLRGRVPSRRGTEPRKLSGTVKADHRGWRQEINSRASSRDQPVGDLVSDARARCKVVVICRPGIAVVAVHAHVLKPAMDREPD